MRNVRSATTINGINPTDWEALIEQGYTQFSVPQMIAHAYLMDIGDQEAYWNNVAEADAASSLTSGGFILMSEDDEGDGSDPCSITNLLQRFSATMIAQTTNGTSISFQSC